MTASAARNDRSGDPAWLDDDTLAAVRPQVRQLLQSSPGFRAMTPKQQQEIARDMVRVAAYMANPDGLAKEELTPGKGVLARAQADAGVDAAKGKASDKLGTFAGSDFEAGAMKQGVDNLTRAIDKVDFPKFVGSLIQNVFQAIVDASIQQMEAYASMLKAVSQSVDQFAQDNITTNNARDWLVQSFPDDLEIDNSNADSEGGSPAIAMKSEDSDAAMARLNQQLQLANPLTDISDPEQEARLVQSARLQMARSRQQLLASMVLLGINRIVVTDGAINAKVIFDLKTEDIARRDARASLYDTKSSRNKNVSGGGVMFGWGGGFSSNVNEQYARTSVSSSVDETSESKAELKTKLTGEVRVNFKSDYFPMEKLASPGMIAAIQGNSKPVDPNINPNQKQAAPA